MAEYNDITQVPFVNGQTPQPITPLTQQPSVLATEPTDSIAPQVLGSDNLPMEPLLRYQSHMRDQEVDNIKQTIAREEKQQSSTGPTILAVLAALSGNFGPAIHLQEQKRQTQIAKTLFPITTRATELINRGEWEQAGTIVNAAATSVGDRSPELMRYLTSMSDRIAKKQEMWAQFETYYEMKKDLIPPDHPNRPYLDALGKAIKRRTPFAETMLNNLETGQRTHVQNEGGYQREYFPATGTNRQTPLPQAVQTSQIDAVAGAQIVKDHGLQSTNDITNLINKQPAMAKDGTIIVPGSDKAQAIIMDYSAKQGEVAAREQAKLIPMDAKFATAYKLMGGTPEELATRQYDNAKVYKAVDFIHQQEVITAEAPILANIRKNPAMWANAGGTFIDANGKEMPLTTIEAYEASGGKIIPTRKDVLDNEIKPALNTISGLDYAVKMVDELRKLGVDLSSNGARLSQGIKRTASSWLGIPISDSVTVAETVASIMNKAVEDTNSGLNKMGRPSAEIGNMKKFTAGSFASPDDAIKALTILQGRLKEVLLQSAPVAPKTALPSQAPGSTAIPKGDVEGALSVYGKGGQKNAPPKGAAMEQFNNAIQQQQQGAPATPPGSLLIPGSGTPLKKR